MDDDKMTRRFTVTEKWDDPDFRHYKPNTKLLFMYLCDKCDIGGFWEIDWGAVVYHTRLTQNAINRAHQELQDANKIESDGKFIRVTNFLKHQRNWPLQENNQAHQAIKKILEKHHNFKNISPQQGGTSPPTRGYGICKGNGKGKGKGKGKSKYGEFVFLSKDEYQKLVKKFGNEETEQRIKDLNYGIGSKGYKYKSHYYTILAWDRKDKNNGKIRGHSETTGIRIR